MGKGCMLRFLWAAAVCTILILDLTNALYMQQYHPSSINHCAKLICAVPYTYVSWEPHAYITLLLIATCLHYTVIACLTCWCVCCHSAACRWYAEKVLPPGNLHPRSLHVVKRVLGIKSPQDVEHHVCENDDGYFGPLKRCQYKAHEDDVCSNCQVGVIVAGVLGVDPGCHYHFHMWACLHTVWHTAPSTYTCPRLVAAVTSALIHSRASGFVWRSCLTPCIHPEVLL